MSQALAHAVPSRPAPTCAPTDFPTRQDLEIPIAMACERIAPLWPLKHFVAVNPFLGFTAQRFDETCATLRRVTGTDMLMPRAFYRQALDDGVIADKDLQIALAAAPWRDVLPASAAAVVEAVRAEPAAPAAPVLPTVETVLDDVGPLQASNLMRNEISKWCAAYFDEGQSVWRLPGRGNGLYRAWRTAMRHDLNPELMGVAGFRASVAALPEDPLATIVEVVKTLGLPRHLFADYLYRCLFDVLGWAAHARYRVWQSALHGSVDDTLIQLLAVRLAWTGALHASRTDDVYRLAWQKALGAAALLLDEAVILDPGLALDLLLQEAYERAYQRRLFARLNPAVRANLDAQRAPRKPLQAAFCIDVRSEIFRRALESVFPAAETLGFAGFFGFPIEYVPIGNQHGGAQCPVLLKPTHTVCEAVADASHDEEQEILGLRLLRRRAMKAWKSFKFAAISSFTYVESMGLLFAGKLLSDSFGYTRPVADPDTDGLDRRVIARMRPRIESRVVGGRDTGFAPEQRVAMAETVLRAMSLTGGFARLVMLTGHGSTTVNNPHASGLDCGACGGHSGAANARVAAQILNDPAVRGALTWRGIRIPADTWFLGCVHDTTTDDITIHDAADVPASHAADLAMLRQRLSRASALARAERAALLGVAKSPTLDAEVTARSRDWSQVRPEWGLAGNAAFIAAPRAGTVGVDLQGRAFLHSYDWQQDTDFKVLEMLMTAPMVVASWINLQYYGSTVNNGVFGAGNKVLHNVVAGLGVLEGNGGDLKVGLPWQSVHDGQGYVHEPLRLNVFIAAPLDALNRVIERHRTVRDLVDNRWIHLFALSPTGWPSHRYVGGLRWVSHV
jgi:uncharacterized protein YbcC (UPF0753/DUF2309 family)